MNVYLYQSGTEKILKNAYIGEYNELYEYSYDFRNKSSTILTNDGWIVESGITYGSNGLSNPSETMVGVYRSIPLLTNAKKITITATTINSSSNFDHSYGVYTISPSSGIINVYSYMGGASLGIAGTSSSYAFGKIDSGTYSQKIEVDLEAKTAKQTYGSLGTQTMNLTDAQISTIRGNSALKLQTKFDKNVTVQDTLVSGTNIKTINGNDILGSGNVSVGTLTAETVVSGDSGTTYTIKKSTTAPGSGTPATTITFVTSS